MNIILTILIERGAITSVTLSEVIKNWPSGFAFSTANLESKILWEIPPLEAHPVAVYISS
jgi:hypothetical protein